MNFRQWEIFAENENLFLRWNFDMKKFPVDEVFAGLYSWKSIAAKTMKFYQQIMNK